MTRQISSINARISEFDLLPESAIISIKELSFISGRSRSSIWRDVGVGRLPKPVATGIQSRGWKVGDVRKYLNGDI